MYTDYKLWPKYYHKPPKIQQLFWNSEIGSYFWFNYDSGQKYYAPKVSPDRGSNSWPPDHDSTFHVTETPALTTWPSVTSLCMCYCKQYRVQRPTFCIQLDPNQFTDRDQTRIAWLAINDWKHGLITHWHDAGVAKMINRRLERTSQYLTKSRFLSFNRFYPCNCLDVSQYLTKSRFYSTDSTDSMYKYFVQEAANI